ncbi:MAG: flippase [Erysipelotrichaceae bacterium]|nr:flippase [Erysipelotrichaceae bacterium]
MKNNRFAVNASWIMIGRVVQLGLTFVTTMLVARYLKPDNYGKLTYVYSYIQFFIPLCTAGMNDIVVKELADNKDANDTILGTMIGVRLFFSLISVICSILLVRLMNNGPLYITIAVLQSFSLLFQCFDSIMYFYQSKMLSQRSGTAYALAYIFSSAFRIIGIVLKKDIRWFAFAMSLDFIMLAFFLLLAYFRDHNHFSFSFETAKQLLKKSRYYIFSGILVVIYGKVTDIFLLGKMVDDTTVGYYGAVTTLCNAWPFILTAIIDSANPIIIDTYNSDKEMFYKRIRQLYAAVFYISVLAALGITLLSSFIIMLLYGQDYLPASVPMKIFAWSTAFSYIGVARTAWMQCKNKIKYETVISFFGAVINILLNYVLIKNFGIIGAASAAVLTQFLTNFIFLFVMEETRENASLILDAILLKGVK